MTNQTEIDTKKAAMRDMVLVAYAHLKLNENDDRHIGASFIHYNIEYSCDISLSTVRRRFDELFVEGYIENDSISQKGYDRLVELHKMWNKRDEKTGHYRLPYSEYCCDDIGICIDPDFLDFGKLATVITDVINYAMVDAILVTWTTQLVEKRSTLVEDVFEKLESNFDDISLQLVEKSLNYLSTDKFITCNNKLTKKGYDRLLELHKMWNDGDCDLPYLGDVNYVDDCIDPDVLFYLITEEDLLKFYVESEDPNFEKLLTNSTNEETTENLSEANKRVNAFMDATLIAYTLHLIKNGKPTITQLHESFHDVISRSSVVRRLNDLIEIGFIKDDKLTQSGYDRVISLYES